MAKIIYTNDNGNMVVITPVSTELTVEEIAAKDVPAGKSYNIVEDSNLPTDRSFRNAWIFSDDIIQVDMTKAKDLMRLILQKLKAHLLKPVYAQQMQLVHQHQQFQQLS